MVISKLNVKLFRDIRFSPFMFGGIVFLLIIGTTLFGASYALYLNLEKSYALSYERLNLADFTVAVQSAPDSALTTLRRIPGVVAVSGRTAEEVEIKQPELVSQKAIGRIISLPDTGTPEIGVLKVIDGTYPKRDASRELLLEASFAEYNNYVPGDTITIVIDDEETEFRVAGVVQSPEYIFVVRGSEYPAPSPRTFGVMWMRKASVDDLFGTSGSYNEFLFTMRKGANRATAMRLAASELEPYGADEPVPQEDQPSVKLLRLDLEGLRNLALFFPILFLTISALSVYNLVSRMVHAQRGQIGFLRAVGFSRQAVAGHYLLFSLIMGLAGGGTGVLLGHSLSIWVTKFYTRFIQVPYFDVHPRWSVIAAGLLSALLMTALSGLLPALTAAHMRPAEALGTELAATGRVPVLERFFPPLARLSLISRLPLRNFLRNPRRTFSTVAGVASAATLILVSLGLFDSMRASIDFYFKYSLHYDIIASYLNPQTESAADRIKLWEGVRRVEPMLTLPAKLVRNGEDQTILLYGLRPGDRLMSIIGENNQSMPLPRTGIIVTDSTAKKLDLSNGSRVLLTVPNEITPETPDIGFLPSYRESLFRPNRALLEINLKRLVTVSGVSYQPLGSAAYASISEVRDWYGRAFELPPNAITGVAIEADPKYAKSIEKKLYSLDGIASVEVIDDVRKEIDELLKSSNVFFTIMLSFSIALATVIMFNSTLMNVIERTREIATLRTVGMSARTAAWLVLAENLISFVIGIIVGIPIGRWMAGQFVQVYESESFSMRTVIFFSTYLVTIFGILASVLAAQIPGISYIRRIELAKATKDVG